MSKILIFEEFSRTVNFFTQKAVWKRNFGFYLIIGNYTNDIRSKNFKKSNISEKIWYLILAEIAKKGIFFTFFRITRNYPG